MRQKKRSLALLLALALALSLIFAGADDEDDFPKVLEQAKKGVVQIYGWGEKDGYWSSWTGTGFAVGEEGEDADVFLTNWHVITASGEYDANSTRIWILQENCQLNENTGEPDPMKSIECELLKTTSQFPDYAIIRAKEEVSGYRPLPLLSSKEVKDGTKVYALGYPAIVRDMSASRYGIDNITSTDGIVSQHMEMVEAGNTWVLMHTAKISGGNSGGPLINKDGVVVGLNTYTFGETKYSQDRYCAVYTDYAIEGLDDLELPYQLYEDGKIKNVNSDKPGKGDSQWLTWTLGGMVPAAVVAAALLLLRKKKEQKEALLRRQREEEEARLRQQQEAEALRRQEELRRQQELSSRITLRTPEGKQAVLPGSGGIMGRERSCAVVLPENAPGVSRTHCRLERQGGQVYLTDLNSSYGTYVNRKRIPPNVPVALPPGASFCLGSDRFTFTVC